MSLRLIVVSCAIALVTLTAPQARAESDCRFTQGYWQNRAQNAGDLTTDIWASLRSVPFYQSGLTFEQVLNVSPQGNAYWILAHQLVAAQANALNGADYTGVVGDALTSAITLMYTLTPAEVAALPSGDPLREELIALSRILDDWNNGLIGSGLCGGGGVDPH